MNGILLVDKPQGFTSHDVVAKLRGILHERRIGHSGTLDPMATGLLVVFVGRATRAVEFAESHEKEYVAGIRTGLTTDTLDITGETLTTCGRPASAAEFQAVLPAFLGEQQQLPPMYSAIKVDGKKLCDLARKGVEVERSARTITIRTLEYLGEEGGDFRLRVVCSKGTYVRTLADDIGKRLGTGAALSSLRRTRAGAFSVEDAHTLAEIQAAADRERPRACFCPSTRCLRTARQSHSTPHRKKSAVSARALLFRRRTANAASMRRTADF